MSTLRQPSFGLPYNKLDSYVINVRDPRLAEVDRARKNCWSVNVGNSPSRSHGTGINELGRVIGTYDCVCVCVCVCGHAYAIMCLFTCTYVLVHACMHTYACLYDCVYVYVYVYVHIHNYVC